MPDPMTDHDLLISLYHRDPRPVWWPDGLRWCGGSKDAFHRHWKRRHWPVSDDTAIAIACHAAMVWLMEHTRNRGGFFLLAPTDSADVYHISIGAGVGVEAPTLLSALVAACEAEVKRAIRQALNQEPVMVDLDLTEFELRCLCTTGRHTCKTSKEPSGD